MSLFRQLKDPDATLDYKFDWSNWLAAGDSIETSVVSVIGPDESLTIVAQSLDGSDATIWLEGGTVGEEYTVTNRVTTADGRIEDRSAIFQIIER